MSTLKISSIFLLNFILFSNITRGQSNDIKSNSHDFIFSKIEVEADFPGGIEAWREFLSKNLNPNVPGDNACPAGKYNVIVKFIVNKEGYIDSIIPETNYGYGMEEEVIRVIKLSPKWKPAMQNGRKVKAYKRQPLMFVVEPEIEEKKNNN